MTGPLMEARTKSSENGTPGKRLIDPRDIGLVSGTRQESLTSEVQEAMNAAEERGSVVAMVDDPRRVSEGNPGLAPTPLTDPRSVKLDVGQEIKQGAGAELLSAPITLGVADIFPVDDTAWEISAVADFDKNTCRHPVAARRTWRRECYLAHGRNRGRGTVGASSGT